MATVLADSPPAPASELGPADPAAGSPSGPPLGAASPPTPDGQRCSRCGAGMTPGQDWCLQCGAGAPGSISSPGWRSAATLIGITAVLALGAAAAAYAALSKETHKPPTVTTTVAQASTPSTTTPAPSTTTPVTPSTTTTLPSGAAVNPPKIPLTATPTPSGSPSGTSTTTTTPAAGETGTPTKTTPSKKSGGTGSEPTQPAILLDTNAAATYNPYNYPGSDFGDPSLTIDGDTTTAWTAIVEPATAPKMAEGVLIDLKQPHKLAAVKLISSSPGMTVQVYGANGATAPASITDPAWVPLSHSQVPAKKHARIKLHAQKKAFTFVTVWISQAPSASVGTPEAPGHVSVNEIELFPVK